MDRDVATFITNIYGENPWLVYVQLGAMAIDNAIRLTWPTFAERPKVATFVLGIIAIPAFNLGHYRAGAKADDSSPLGLKESAKP